MNETTGASGLGDTLGTIQECWRKNHILPQNAADWLISEVERLRKGLAAVAALIAESRGVAGLHLNGDEAPWDELRTGGVSDMVDDNTLTLSMAYDQGRADARGDIETLVARLRSLPWEQPELREGIVKIIRDWANHSRR